MNTTQNQDRNDRRIILTPEQVARMNPAAKARIIQIGEARAAAVNTND